MVQEVGTFPAESSADTVTDPPAIRNKRARLRKSNGRAIRKDRDVGNIGEETSIRIMSHDGIGTHENLGGIAVSGAG
jgi:hypothetical protein